jgi:hypothetical protein
LAVTATPGVAVYQFIDLHLPTEWPVEGSGNLLPYPPHQGSTVKASAISPDGKWIVGTYHDPGPPDISHYFLLRQDATNPLSYSAQPLSNSSQITARSVNDDGDVAGWTSPDPKTVAFFLKPGHALSRVNFPGKTTNPAESAAYGVSNGPFLVGSYPGDGSSPAQIAFGVKFDSNAKQIGDVEQLNTEMGPAVIDGNTSLPVVGDYVILAANSRQDLLATVTPRNDVTIGSNVLPAGVDIHLVGLMTQFVGPPPGGLFMWRTWHLLKNPANGMPLSGVTLLALNSNRQIVGYEGPLKAATGVYTEVSGDGILSPIVSVSHSKAKTTILTGISDEGMMVGAYDQLHPVLAFFVSPASFVSKKHKPYEIPEPIYYMIPRPDPRSIGQSARSSGIAR